VVGFLRLLVLCLFGLQAAWAEEPSSGRQGTDFSQWMTYYYVYKDAAKMPDFLQWMQNSQILEENESAEAPLAAFLSVIFAENPQRIASSAHDVEYTGRAREAVEYAPWLSGNGETIARFFGKTPSYAESSPEPLSALIPNNPGDLDLMWAAFFASGNILYLGKIVDVLDDGVPLTGNKTRDLATRAAAKWSLGSNMLQHERVNRFVLEQMDARSGAAKTELQKIVAQNDKGKHPFPARDGEFSAMLIVSDEKSLQEYDKPSSEGMQFQTVANAKRGDMLAIKVVFAGMQLTDDLMADVTYDLKMVTPDGGLYDATDLTGMEALKGKVPMRFSIFDNRSFIKVRFEPQDPSGTYRIVAAINDNVGRKRIPLSAEVRLTD